MNNFNSLSATIQSHAQKTTIEISNNNSHNKNNSSNISKVKFLVDNSNKNADFKLSKIFFNNFNMFNSINNYNNYNIHLKLLNFLTLKDRLKIKHITYDFYISFIKNEHDNLISKLTKKKYKINNYNPLNEVDSYYYINECKKKHLSLSEFNINNSFITFFIKCLYTFTFLKLHSSDITDNNIDINNLVELLQSKSTENNIYTLMPIILDNITNNKDLFNILSNNINSKPHCKNTFEDSNNYNNKVLNFDFLSEEYPDERFNCFCNLFKDVKNLVYNNKKINYLLDCEIIEDKIERFKKHFKPFLIN